MIIFDVIYFSRQTCSDSWTSALYGGGGQKKALLFFFVPDAVLPTSSTSSLARQPAASVWERTAKKNILLQNIFKYFF